LPSFNLYRGSLLALLIGSGIAIWLLVQPPGEGSSDTVVLAGTTPTTFLTPVEETITPTDGGGPTPTRPAATPTRQGTPTRVPPTATPAPVVYIVQEGDTLLSIAEANLPPGGTLSLYANRIAQENGLEPDAVLAVGTELVLP
jgi:hypothetical protein